MVRAVFLDRDGTLIEDSGYVSGPKEVRIFPDVPAALRRLHDQGFVLVVVTNQSGVARGFFNEAAVEAVHDVIREAVGDRIARFIHCPHLPTGILPEYAIDCDCRKPKPGMILRALKELEIEKKKSFMIGDSLRDLMAGRSAGVRTALVLTGKATGDPPPQEADHVAPTFTEAVDWVLAQ